jgi:hypothetical protein
LISKSYPGCVQVRMQGGEIPLVREGPDRERMREPTFMTWLVIPEEKRP